jgi:hypothetical protein
MAVYLIHFDEPIGDLSNPHGQAHHYLGYTEDLEERLARHRAGNGARLLEVLAERGISWRLARVWPDGDKALERRLKNCHGGGRFCPICDPDGAMNHARL